jgi:hypothetical protein
MDLQKSNLQRKKCPHETLHAEQLVQALVHGNLDDRVVISPDSSVTAWTFLPRRLTLATCDRTTRTPGVVHVNHMIESP